MATTTTAITPKRSRNAYIGIGLEADNSPIPQAEVIFSGVTNTVTAAGVGEDQSFSITCQLAPGYAYVLTDANLFMQATEDGDTADWDADLSCILENRTSGGQDTGRWRIGQQLHATALVNIVTAGTNRRFYTIEETTNKLILPVLGTDGRFTVNGFNTTTDGGALSLDYVFKFLEFSVKQANHWAINTPWPVR